MYVNVIPIGHEIRNKAADFTGRGCVRTTAAGAIRGVFERLSAVRGRRLNQGSGSSSSCRPSTCPTGIPHHSRTHSWQSVTKAQPKSTHATERPLEEQDERDRVEAVENQCRGSLRSSVYRGCESIIPRPGD